MRAAGVIPYWPRPEKARNRSCHRDHEPAVRLWKHSSRKTHENDKDEVVVHLAGRRRLPPRVHASQNAREREDFDGDEAEEDGPAGASRPAAGFVLHAHDFCGRHQQRRRVVGDRSRRTQGLLNGAFSHHATRRGRAEVRVATDTRRIHDGLAGRSGYGLKNTGQLRSGVS